jgi:uncharacterized membrane protein
MAGNTSHKIRFITEFAVLLAIEAIFCFTPLGSIPFTPVIVATLAGVPVVICAILMGTYAGALLGFTAGLFSMIVWTFMPPNPVLAFMYTPFYSLGPLKGNGWSLFICFVPRILIGVGAGMVYHGFRKAPLLTAKTWKYFAAGMVGSMCNTLITLGTIYFAFGRQYVEAIGGNTANFSAIVLAAISGLILTNGVPEAIVCALAGFFVCKPVQAGLRRIQR